MAKTGARTSTSPCWRLTSRSQPKLKRKKYVLIKPNNVTTTNQLGATHADALRGILDYLAPRFKGPVIIAESSAGNTMQGFDNFKYPALTKEYKKVSLLDLQRGGQVRPRCR